MVQRGYVPQPPCVRQVSVSGRQEVANVLPRHHIPVRVRRRDVAAVWISGACGTVGYPHPLTGVLPLPLRGHRADWLLSYPCGLRPHMFRFSRPLRPFLLLAKKKSLRRLFAIMVKVRAPTLLT